MVKEQTEKKKKMGKNNTGDAFNPIIKLGLMEKYRTVHSVTRKIHFFVYILRY